MPTPPPPTQIRMCVDKNTLYPIACPAGGGPPFISTTCGTNHTETSLYYSPFARMGRLSIDWRPFLVMLSAVLVVMMLMWGLYALIKKHQGIPGLFLAKKPIVVQYDLVHLPVKVLCEQLDMDWLWKTAPSLAECVDDLPVGMGIKVWWWLCGGMCGGCGGGVLVYAEECGVCVGVGACVVLTMCVGWGAVLSVCVCVCCASCTSTAV